MIKVLLLDSNNRAALAVTRALGKASMEVITISFKEACIASTSRFCHQGFVVNSTLKDKESLEEIFNKLESIKPDYLIPITDAALRLVFKNYQKFEGKTKVISCQKETFEMIDDKSLFYNYAEKEGLLLPKTKILQSNDVVSMPQTIQDLEFPVVVKPSLSNTSFKAAYFKKKEELLGFVSKQECFPMLIQEQIIGKGFGYFVLCKNGEILLDFAHKRVLEKPFSGGVSVIAEAVEVSRQIKELSSIFLKKLNYTGVAMLEFKQKEETGEFYLLEINPRFWGSLELAISSGINFPKFLIELYQGKLVKRSDRYPKGRLLWLFGLLDIFLIEIKNLRFTNVLEILSEAFSSLFNKVYFDVLSLRDIKPFFMEGRGWLGNLKK